METKQRKYRTTDKNTLVRALTTNVNFDIVERKFDDTMAALLQIADGRPIFDIRCDKQTTNWRDAYDRFLSVPRKLNQSRVYRRMNPTGFRLLNVDQSRIVTDTIIAGLDEMTILLNGILQEFVNARQTVARIHVRARATLIDNIPDIVRDWPDWNRREWNIYEDRLQRNGTAAVFHVVAPTHTLAHIICSLYFRIKVDIRKVIFRNNQICVYSKDMIPDDLHERFRYNDIFVALSDRQIRRFQTFGVFKNKQA